MLRQQPATSNYPSVQRSILGDASSALVIRVHDSNSPVREFQINESKCKIGSADGCVVKLAGAEPVHCAIMRGPGGAVVRRWGASALLNGRQFDDARLRDGDVIQIGDSRIEIQLSHPSYGSARSEPTQANTLTDPEVRALVERLHSAESRVTDLQSQFHSTQNSAREIADRMSRIETLIREKHSDRLQDSYDRLRGESENLERQLAEQRTAYERSQEKWTAEETRLKAELALSAEVLEDERRRNREAAEQIEALNRGSAAEMESRFEELQAAETAVKEKRSNVDAALAALEARRATNEQELHRKTKELESKQAELDAANNKLKDELADLEARKVSLADATDQRIAELNSAVEEKEAELKQVREELESCQQQLAQQAQQFNSEKESLVAKSDSLGEEIAVLGAERDELVKCVESLTAQLEQSTSNQPDNDLLEKYDALVGEVNDLSAQLEVAQAAETRAHRAAAEAEDIQATLHQRTNEWQQREEELLAKIENLEGSLSRSNESLAETQELLEEARESLAISQQTTPADSNPDFAEENSEYAAEPEFTEQAEEGFQDEAPYEHEHEHDALAEARQEIYSQQEAEDDRPEFDDVSEFSSVELEHLDDPSAVEFEGLEESETVSIDAEFDTEPAHAEPYQLDEFASDTFDQTSPTDETASDGVSAEGQLGLAESLLAEIQAEGLEAEQQLDAPIPSFDSESTGNELEWAQPESSAEWQAETTSDNRNWYDEEASATAEWSSESDVAHEAAQDAMQESFETSTEENDGFSLDADSITVEEPAASEFGTLESITDADEQLSDAESFEMHDDDTQPASDEFVSDSFEMDDDSFDEEAGSESRIDLNSFEDFDLSDPVATEEPGIQDIEPGFAEEESVSLDEFEVESGGVETPGEEFGFDQSDEDPFEIAADDVDSFDTPDATTSEILEVDLDDGDSDEGSFDSFSFESLDTVEESSINDDSEFDSADEGDELQGTCDVENESDSSLNDFGEIESLDEVTEQSSSEEDLLARIRSLVDTNDNSDSAESLDSFEDASQDDGTSEAASFGEMTFEDNSFDEPSFDEPSFGESEFDTSEQDSFAIDSADHEDGPSSEEDNSSSSSAADVLAQMGHHMEQPGDEEPLEPTARPQTDSFELADDQFGGSTLVTDDTNDDSIEDYMAKLLQRVGDSPGASETPAHAEASDGPKPRKKARTEVATVSEDSESPRRQKTRTANMFAAQDSTRARVRTKVDLDAIREIANESTRNAITRAKNKSTGRQAVSKIFTTMIALLAAAILLTLSRGRMSVFFMSGIVALIISGYFGYLAAKAGAFRILGSLSSVFRRKRVSKKKDTKRETHQLAAAAAASLEESEEKLDRYAQESNPDAFYRPQQDRVGDTMLTEEIGTAGRDQTEFIGYEDNLDR